MKKQDEDIIKNDPLDIDYDSAEEEMKEDRESDVSWFKHTRSESREPPCLPEELRNGKALLLHSQKT